MPPRKASRLWIPERTLPSARLMAPIALPSYGGPTTGQLAQIRQ